MIFKKKFLFVLLFFGFASSFAQTDFSTKWEDHFSYNNVRSFLIRNNSIYALTENAVFIYNIDTEETQKISSVNGLSGENTSAIYFDEDSERLIIGYETGLVEVLENDGTVRVSADIVNFNQSGDKRINHISASGDILYLSLPFGIVEYNISRLEFGDTFFIGNNSGAIEIRETLIEGDFIYAATENGIYRAELSNPNLIDFNNWTQLVTGNFTQIDSFNNTIYTVDNTVLYRLNATTVTQVRSFSSRIQSVDFFDNSFVVTENERAHVLDSFLNSVTIVNSTTEFDFTLNQSLIFNNGIYLATDEFGILQTSNADITSFSEIHPEGPLRNDVFSVKAKDSNLWVVYGGYDNTFAVLNTNIGYSHFDGNQWFNTRFSFDNPLPDLVDITFDRDNSNKVYLSGFGDTRQIGTRRTGGILVIEEGVETEFLNHTNSGLQDLAPNDPTRVSVRVSGASFDNQGSLWVTNINTPTELKKFSNGNWTGFDISGVKFQNATGLTDIVVDRANSVWIGTRRDGVIAFNENGNRLRALNTSATQGSLPNPNVKSLAVDNNNRIWIGTLSGLVVFNNANNVFDASIVDAEPIIILEDGVPRRLLGDQTVNSIVVDGANNKWFGTNNGGVIYTNPNGQTTLATFNKENSPLPSNKINKITVDESTGKVYFATDRGVVAYDSNVSPFGTELGDVYAYPNPAQKFHQTVTIDGRNGTNLPRGTNVKILDVSGNLVFETNVIESQQLNGGKVVWDKRNLAGNLVASGVYVVLLSNEDASETSVTKIAIIN